VASGGSAGKVIAFALAFSVASVGLSANARADEPAPTAAATSAQDQYTAGRESYRLGLFGRALEEFERSLALVASPNTRLYLARTFRELGRWSEAAEQYRITIREADERGGRYIATRDAADMELRDVKVRIERGEAAPAAPKGERNDKPVDGPAPLAPAPSAATTPVTPSSTTSGGPTTLTWVTGGLAVAGTASFAIFYALASDRYGYLEDNCSLARDASCDSARTTGQTEEIVSYVSLGVAAVAATIAIVSLVVRPSVSSSNRASVAPNALGSWRLAF
jgi:hypothetical protein